MSRKAKCLVTVDMSLYISLFSVIAYDGRKEAQLFDISRELCDHQIEFLETGNDSIRGEMRRLCRQAEEVYESQILMKYFSSTGEMIDEVAAALSE